MARRKIRTTSKKVAAKKGKNKKTKMVKKSKAKKVLRAKKKKITSKKATTRKKSAAKKKTSGTKIMKSRPSTGAMKTPAASSAQTTTRNTKITRGDMAPDFTLPNQSGQPISLSALQGRTVVLYFYPKDDTPGCTKEACSFRDSLPHFNTNEAVIYGVSFDDPQSHQNFISKYGLNFDLLSDTEKQVAEAYGVYVEKNMYGKTYMGIERSTFIIDPSGRISEIFHQVKVDGHTEEVLEALKKIA